MNKILGSALLITLLALGGCGKNTGVGGTAGDAETATQKANELIAQELNLADPLDFEDAKRGFIAAPEGKIMAADGTTVLIDFDAYKFIDGKAPATVNPSLWRHATLNKGVGLYKVRDGVHQLRGFDIANITLIDGKTGWIVVDALTSRESSAAAMAFARKHLGNKPVTALVFTHSHADHFGGALGRGHAAGSGRTQDPRVASEGFMEEATSENILVGTGDGAPLDVPVRQEPAGRPEGRGGYRPGQERGLRRHRHPGAHPAHHPSRPRSWCSTACAWCSTTCPVPRPRPR
jgi:alkyl sulfatase BDS1-like metallo-beta-lactamase superfamily hydrolase